MALQCERGAGRAGEGDEILLLQPVEEIAGAADDQLKGTLRQ